jgi:hypothetical protein
MVAWLYPLYSSKFQNTYTLVIQGGPNDLFCQRKSYHMALDRLEEKRGQVETK